MQNYYENFFALTEALSNELVSLNKKVNKIAYNVVALEFSVLGGNLINKTFKFKAVNDGFVTINMFSNALISGIEVKINNVVAVKGNQLPNSFTVGVQRGENEISFTLNTPLNFDVKVSINILGNVEKFSETNRFTACVINETNYIVISNGKTASFNKIINGKLTEIYLLKNVKQCNIVGVGNNVIYVIYINSNNKLCFGYLAVESVVFYVTFISNYVANSACGYQTQTGFTLYYTALNQTYACNYVLGGAYVFNKISIKGGEIYSTYNVPNAFVISDVSGNSRLVLVNNGAFKQINIGKAKNCHFVNAENLQLYFNNGLFVQKAVLNGENVVSVAVDSYLDEKNILTNGLIIERNGDDIEVV